MTTTEFESIKNKIKQLELGAATAKGKIETIESNWQKKYGFSTLEEAKKKREELKSEIAEKNSGSRPCWWCCAARRRTCRSSRR